VTWSDVAVAGAFVLGIVAGGIGSIRVFKYAVEYLRSERQANDDSARPDRP
jgi:hypothetical protein